MYNFIFAGGQLNNPLLVQFFSEYGSRVHHLTLKTEIAEMATLENIVFKWAPNLKSLVLAPSNWDDGPSLPKDDDGKGIRPRSKSPISENSQLPNLRKITLPKIESSDLCPGGHLFQRILTSAPHLLWIEDPDLAYIPQIIAAGKFPLVKSLTWNFLQYGLLDQNLLRFVGAGPKLRGLNFGVYDFKPSPLILPALQSLLLLSQATLENITLLEVFTSILDPSFRPQFQIPPLPRVTHLQVWACEPPQSRIIPEGHALCRVFPNLKSLHVVVLELNLTHHPFDSPSYAHDLVQKLKISCVNCFRGGAIRGEGLRSEWIEVMGRLFPKVTHLDLVFRETGAVTLPQCLKVIPKSFPLLEQIFIKVDPSRTVSVEKAQSFKRQMDEALTGLPQNILEQLRRSSEPQAEFQKPEVLEQIRIAPSILDLKKLTSLTFEVDFETGALPLWSRMAHFYAFQPMAKRQGFEVYVRGSHNQRKLVPLARTDLGPL